jgi:glycosyltransferase involved in cell wall biosynthesis
MIPTDESPRPAANAIEHTPCDVDAATVSIGLPVYNGEEFLEEAIVSLLNQSFRDFELIVSDNASTDATPDIVRKYQKEDHRIRYIRQENNIGPGNNFIYVLTQAKARLFMWASHDDIWAHNWLETLIENLTPEDIGVRGGLLLMKGDSIVAEKILPNFRRGDFIRCFFGNENNYRSHYTYSLFYREKLLEVGLEAIKLDYYPDAIFVYSLLEQGGLRSIPETSIRYRIHDRNLGSDYSGKWKGWRKIIYRIHPFRYYHYYLSYTKDPVTRLIIVALIPFKHIYAQSSFWFRGFREIVTGKPRL